MFATTPCTAGKSRLRLGRADRDNKRISTLANMLPVRTRTRGSNSTRSVSLPASIRRRSDEQIRIQRGAAGLAAASAMPRLSKRAHLSGRPWRERLRREAREDSQPARRAPDLPARLQRRKHPPERCSGLRRRQTEVRCAGPPLTGQAKGGSAPPVRGASPSRTSAAPRGSPLRLGGAAEGRRRSITPPCATPHKMVCYN